ncbi:CinA family protein [Pseudomonas sp. RIT-PI-S]|uniref:CinA family protein n=1 Tax=Pseudomonas sp. RIT-PI-S TaxID=3035295 RepID=UPI0021DB6EE2|nr:CinA family protein [Pseudomonas sp. RIT-PI-S]
MIIPDTAVEALQATVNYLSEHSLYLATAESCTAGLIAAALGSVPGGGKIMESGYVVYSPEAKHRLLGVGEKTIDLFGLTSEEVAREMAAGALHDSEANMAVATTGVAGPEPMDGITPGTVCFAWAFSTGGATALFSRTERFFGDRQEVMRQATCFALRGIAAFHRRALNGETV